MKIWTSLKLIVVLCIFIACKKEEVKQYSYWKIDGKEYSSNNVWVNGGERGDGRRNLVSGGDESFSIGFNTGISSLPDQGVFLLVGGIPTQNATNERVGFLVRHAGKGYFPSAHERKYLQAERVNGKVRYTMPETWFVNTSSDSILVSGTFNEP